MPIFSPNGRPESIPQPDECRVKGRGELCGLRGQFIQISNHLEEIFGSRHEIAKCVAKTSGCLAHSGLALLARQQGQFCVIGLRGRCQHGQHIAPDWIVLRIHPGHQRLDQCRVDYALIVTPGMLNLFLATGLPFANASAASSCLVAVAKSLTSDCG